MATPPGARCRISPAWAQSATWDQQGRIMVKEKLRQRAGLKKEAVLVGAFTHFEIWGQVRLGIEADGGADGGGGAQRDRPMIVPPIFLRAWPVSAGSGQKPTGM